MSDYEGAEKFITLKLSQQLPGDLTYHSYFHVMDVLKAALRIAEHENVNEADSKLLRIGVLFHDAGFTITTINHEMEGCKLASKELPNFGFNSADIEAICGMIMATKVPQSPVTHLEKIICDADLDYLGRDDFYSVGRLLFEEMKVYQNVKDEKQWNRVQMNFLKSHYYHTTWCRKHRELRKQEHLNEIIRLVESY